MAISLFDFSPELKGVQEVKKETPQEQPKAVIPQTNFTMQENKDKKVTILLKWSYTSDSKLPLLQQKPIPHLFGRYEGDYDGCIGGSSLDCHQSKEELIKWLKDNLLEDGYSESNISIEERQADEDDMKQWESWRDWHLNHTYEMAKRNIDKAKKEYDEYKEILEAYTPTKGLLRKW